MFKKIIYSIAILFLTFQSLNAQSNAEQILTNLLTSAKTNAIKTDFKLVISDKNNPQAMASSGTFTLKGSKFVLEMNEMKVWFDGKTQWAYVEQNNEVSITEPSEKELSETNPMSILSGFKSKCNIRFSPKIKSAQNHCIEMLPKAKLDITKIEVQITKSTNNLVSIKLFNKNGSTSLLSLSNFQKGVNAADNIFVFNKTKYKTAVVNDLR